MNPELDHELELALQMADLADSITLPRFRARDFAVDTKPDHSLVTEADRAAERALRGLVEAERPDHGFLGEETGHSDKAEWTWIIDPIDGTNNFVRGVPVWATLIALTRDDVSVLGVVSAPSLHRRWWAALGMGAHLNQQRIEVSAVEGVSEAHVSFNAMGDFARHGGLEAMTQLTDSAWRVRGFGDFWSHMLVAEGAVDIAVEAVVAPWDLAALQVIIEEAGGRFTDLSGHATYTGGSALSTNGLLHDDVLALFATERGARP